MSKIPYQPAPKNRTLDLPKGDAWRSKKDLDLLLDANQNYCEIRRNFPYACRGLYFSLMLFCLGAGLFVIASLFYAVYLLKNNLSYELYMLLLFLVSTLFIYGIPLTQLRRTLFQSEFCPVRFNRKTKLVYIYEHDLSSKPSLLMPLKTFFSIPAPVIKVYPWHTIEAILTRNVMVSSFGSASTDFDVRCLVLASGTLNVIDEFVLCNQVIYDEGVDCWNWICAYMNGDNQLNLTGNVPELSALHYWGKKAAPLPAWPESLDKMSKAKSVVELYNLEQQYKVNNISSSTLSNQ